MNAANDHLPPTGPVDGDAQDGASEVTTIERTLAVLVALVRWGDQRLPNQAETILVHAPCGTELVQGFWCDTCATVFGPGAIRSAQPR